MNGQEKWTWAFEYVIVPMSGLAGIIAAIFGAPAPPLLYPVLSGMLAFPAARKWDRTRRNGNGKE